MREWDCRLNIKRANIIEKKNGELTSIFEYNIHFQIYKIRFLDHFSFNCVLSFLGSLLESEGIHEIALTTP